MAGRNPAFADGSHSGHLVGVLAPKPIEEASGLGGPARAGLASWLEGKWCALSPAARREAAAWLEGQLLEPSGRPLKTRAFLDEVRRV